MLQEKEFYTEGEKMALYEYKCNKCGKVSEILVFSADEATGCKHCGSNDLEKLLSSFAVSMAPSSSSNPPPPSCPMSGSCGSSCGLG